MKTKLKYAGLILAAALLAVECAFIPSEASALGLAASSTGSGPYIPQGNTLNLCFSLANESHVYVEEHTSELGNCAAGYEQLTVVADPGGYTIPESTSGTSADTVTVIQPKTQDNSNSQAVTLDMSASSSDGYAITSWTATGLPDDLTINSDGVISGTLSATAETYTVTVTATDSVGTVGSVTFNWVVSS